MLKNYEEGGDDEFYSKNKSPEGFFKTGHNNVTFLINNEAILYIIVMNIILYLSLKAIVYIYAYSKGDKIYETKPNCLAKFIIKNEEKFEWDHHIK